MRNWLRLLPYVAVWTAVSAVVLLFAYSQVAKDRAADAQTGNRDLANLSALLAEHVERRLEVSRHQLDTARAVFAKDGALKALPAAADRTENDLVVSIFDADGRFLAANDPSIPSSVHVDDREFFRAARHRSDDDMVIGAPLVTRLTHQWAVPLALRISAPDGSFAGASVSALSSKSLVDVYRSFDRGDDGFLGLIYLDGILIAKSPLAQLAEDTSIPDEGFARELNAKSALTDFQIVPRQVGDKHYIVAFRRLIGAPLWVFVGLDEQVVFAGSKAFSDSVVTVSIFAIAALALPLGILGLQRVRLEQRHSHLERKFAVEQGRARLDPLTGAANRRLLNERLAECHAALQQSGEPFVLVAIDLDHFKELNDKHGHSAGDVALRRLVSIFDGLIRQNDTVARLGGDEFVLLMPGADLEVARRVLDNFRDLFDRGSQTDRWKLGVSAAALRFETPLRAEKEYIAAADQSLYAIKRSGRNDTVFVVHA